MSTHKIHAKNLYKTFVQGSKWNDSTYRRIPVLKNVSATFEQGKTYAITGASGSGKSTLLHLLGGLESPTKGEIFFNEKNIGLLKNKEKEHFLNTSIGFVFQFHYLINELSVLENIILKGLIDGRSKKVCVEEAKELLNHFGMADKARSYPQHLSGGEQQRISIIRSIFNKPDFVLADEPTGNLDAQNAKKIVDFFLNKLHFMDKKIGLVICSHDKAVYEKMDHVLQLKDGLLENV